MIESVRFRWEFQLLRDTGRHRRSGPLSVRYTGGQMAGAADDPLPPAVRVAFAIGTSVGNAVERNRLRRRLKELLRDFDTRDALVPGWYLISASPQAKSASFGELRYHLTRLTSQRS